ncbi:MAG: hypothetical protein JXA81_07865 [Sedimentisphaerales bacterium]|nr:hypothetical protein [Sedimentisphaerales bacterium]
MEKILLTILLVLIVSGSGCAKSGTSTSTKIMNAEEMQQCVQNRIKNDETEEINKEWEDAREQLRKQLKIDHEYLKTEEREQVETQLSESKQQDRESQIHQFEPIPIFTYLRKWRPNNIQNGYGADILLNGELSEQELVSFVKRLAGSHDPVIIRIFTSRIAYAQEQNNNYGPEYDRES